MKSVEQILSKVLGIDAKKITDESGPDNLENWDSFNAFMIITELEKNFKTTFSLEEVVGVKNVMDIKKIIKKHGIKSQ